MSITVDPIPLVDNSGKLFIHEMSDSLILVQGLAYGGVGLISDSESIITEIISLLPNGSSTLEITLKDVINMQSVRPLSAMFNIELKDANGALIAEG